MENEYVVLSFRDMEGMLSEKRTFAGTVEAAINIMSSNGYTFLESATPGGAVEILCFFRRKGVE